MSGARRLALALLVASTLGVTPAFGQAENKAAAEVLFQKGKELMARQEYAQACSAFLESDRLDPGIGTKLRLADCYAVSGKTASAWAQFVEAAEAAARSGDTREKVARKKAAELEPHLPKLILEVESRGEAIEVTRDGVPVGKASWSVAIPVDPGAHEIVASAPNRQSWSGKAVAQPGRTVKLTVPVLQAATEAPPVTKPTPVSPAPNVVSPPPPPPEDTQRRSTWTTQRTLGAVAMGAGVVGLGVGTFFGLSAKSKLDASNEDGHCRPENRCDSTGVGLRDDFLGAATVSTIAFIAGGVLVVGGGALYLTAPRRVAIAPAFTGREGGLVMRGSF